MAKRIARPEEQGYPPSQTVRKYPALTNLSNGQRRSLDDLARRYLKFIHRAVTPNRVVDEVIEQAIRKGYTDRPSRTKPFYILGPDDKTFALVRPGRKLPKGEDPLKNGLRVISTHVDSPCLITRMRPLFFEWDPDEKELYHGVYLDIYPYGGPNRFQWGAIPVKVLFHGVRSGRRWEKELTGKIIGHSAHLDPDDEAGEDFKIDRAKVFTAHASRKALLNELGFSSEDDFFTVTGYVVPKISEDLLGKDWVESYGCDDRICVFTATDAQHRARRTTNTCVVMGFDYEESGSTGAGGADSNLFREFVEVIQEAFGSELTYNQLMKASQGISADVCYTSGPHENEAKDKVDKWNIPRMGYGVALCAQPGLEYGNNIPEDYRYHFQQLIKRGRIRAQYPGEAEPADYVGGAGTVGNFLTNKGLLSIDGGPPVGESHSITELVHGGDAFWSRELYQAFFESTRPYRRIHKRRMPKK